MVRLDATLQSWKATRADAAQAVLDFPAGEMDFTPAEGLMTFRQIARHILEAGNALAGVMLDGETNMYTPDIRERFKTYYSGLADDASQEQLAAEMRASVERLCARLESHTAEYFAEIITRFDGQVVTRMEMLLMVKEHELTHRQQLFTYLRLKGIVPPTTRRKLAKK
ncbi:MAG: DinB family protein [Candidatus Solibacter usitatus]|nr:DinB family protein [Candidatus Solibacter usitatus]